MIDGWMHGLLAGALDCWIAGLMNGWMYGCIDGCMDGSTNRLID